MQISIANIIRGTLIGNTMSVLTRYISRVVNGGGIVESPQCVETALNSQGLLQQASLLVVPSGYKGGTLYSEIPTNGNGDLTWTRASTAIRTNSSGLLESMATGVPRLSYMYGSCPSVLLEPQRTNLYTYSEQFDNAAWVKNNATITANSTTSPDGTTNADTITDNTTVGLHQVQQTISATVGTYTLSCYAKAGTLSYVGLYNNSANAGKFFNLSNGTTASNIVNAPTTATIQSVGNGWYRCTITINTLVASSNWQILVSEDGSNFNYIGTGKNAFIYGAQLEAGAYPTTYIPTTSAQATRVADSFSRNNIFTNGLITSSGGTWFVELRNNIVYTRDAVGIAIQITDGTFQNLVRLRFPPSGRIIIDKVVSNVGTFLIATTSTTCKLAIKWNGTTMDIFENGTKVVSATSFTPTIMESLLGDGAQAPTFIQQMALIPEPLTDIKLIELTTL